MGSRDSFSFKSIVYLNNNGRKMKIDKKAFKIQTFKEAADHQSYYMELPEEKKKDLFFKLMQAAYGFVGEDWPKMDKNHFEEGTLLKSGKSKTQHFQ
jgi:hypothetical protein